MRPEKLDLLIVSDLHAHSDDPSLGAAPSFLSTNSLYSTINPLLKIPKLMHDENLTADWILCPGDLGDGAKPDAQAFAWQQLSQLKQDLSASHLIATTGNHDVDSRRYFPEFDPKGSLQQLAPTFPISLDCFESNDGVYADRFWSRNFVTIPFVELDCSLVVVNSCGFHGFSSERNARDTDKAPPKKSTVPGEEYLRGKLSELTRAAIEKSVRDTQTRLNIILVHHHPIKLPHVDDGNSLMIGGAELIELLKATGRKWLIIHGHEHFPFLTYSDADHFAPVVFSAGSVSAKTFPVAGVHPRNQIHHVRIDLAAMESGGMELLGEVTTWSWINTSGWQRARPGSGVPYLSGFGHRFDIMQMRDAIVTMAKNTGLLDWRDVLTAHPKLKYVVPTHLQELITVLRKVGVAVEVEEYGQPTKMEYKGV